MALGTEAGVTFCVPALKFDVVAAGLAEVLIGCAISVGEFTNWMSAAEVLLLKLVSPLYTAVMLCFPTANVDVVKVALPEEFKVPAPIDVAPSRNVTVPVGVPELGEVATTVAVNVTGVKASVGFAEEASVVEVEALFTVWSSGAEVLPPKFASPP